MDHDHHHSHHFLYVLVGQGYQSRTLREQRRAVLWRARMKLEYQVQGLLVRLAVLVQAWQSLHGLQAALEHEMPQIVSRMVHAALAGIPQLPTDWQHTSELDRLAREEICIQQDLLICSTEIAALQAQINLLDCELAQL